MAWAGIWQDGHARVAEGFPQHAGSVDAPLAAMTLWLEIAAPRRARKPVRLWQGAAHPDRAIVVLLMPDGALRVVHGEALDIRTPAGFLAPGHVLRLRLVVCARGRSDVIDMLNTDTGVRHRVRTAAAMSARLEEVLPREQGFLDCANVAAVASHALPSTDLPGIESGAMIATPEGDVPVEKIAPGMAVIGHDGAAHVVRWADARERVCLGRNAPVLLRAPFFGLDADVCVTPETRLMRNGADVEYLAGTEAVLVRAGDLVSGGTAMLDRRRPVRRFHHIMLDDPACLHMWRCRVETAFLSEVLDAEDARPALARPGERDCVPSLPLLDRAATRALLTRGARPQSFVL
jgi:hypothetical protein